MRVRCNPNKEGVFGEMRELAILTLTLTCAVALFQPLPVAAHDTDFRSRFATGEDYGQWTSASTSNAYPSNDQHSEEDSNTGKQDWYSFDFGVPSGSPIEGIEVRIGAQDPYCNVAAGAEVELLWDGG
jgi:hypothetical protein